MDLAKKIKEIRLHNFLSQEEFAKRLGVSYATVNRWETGKTVPIKLKYQAMSLACEFKKWRDSMKFCTQCGSQLTDDAKFCTACGSQQAQITDVTLQLI